MVNKGGLSPRMPIEFAEFEREYTGKRYEYVDGCAVPMGPAHAGDDGQTIVTLDEVQGIVLDDLASRIALFVESQFLGTTFVDVGFWLNQNPPELRGADIGFVSRKRLARSSIPDDWLPLAPDLVVRLCTPEIDIPVRIPLDAEHGPRLLWIVDTAAQEIEVHRPDEPVQRLGCGDVLEGGDVLPGFTLSLDEIFAVEDEPFPPDEDGPVDEAEDFNTEDDL